jgi:hypothetical protein
MATGRTMAWGTLAVTLVAAVAWAQPPTIEPPASRPPGADAPATNDGGRAGTGGFYFAGGNQGWATSNAFGGAKDKAQVAQLAQQYVKSAKEDDKKEIRKKLSDALGQQFDQLAGQQQKELEDLEKQVSALRALLKKRHDSRDAIIDRRLDQVLQEAEGLGWGTHSTAPQAPYYSVPQGRR